MRRLNHLTRRFFGSLAARRPTSTEQSFVAGLLTDSEAEVFWSQPVPDLDHAVRSAQSVATAAPGRVDLARAALLHDVGKRLSGTGTVGRSMATVLSAARLPTPGRMGSYLDHARLGAEELESLGCEDLVVQFARHHHGIRPTHIAAGDWEILLDADDE
ncbi:MAG: HDIG domain-containing metalloprotein [Acidimicrobiia bacterium]